jgi:hypothetical protein
MHYKIIFKILSNEGSLFFFQRHFKDSFSDKKTSFFLAIKFKNNLGAMKSEIFF